MELSENEKIVQARSKMNEIVKKSQEDAALQRHNYGAFLSK